MNKRAVPYYCLIGLLTSFQGMSLLTFATPSLAQSTSAAVHEAEKIEEQKQAIELKEEEALIRYREKEAQAKAREEAALLKYREREAQAKAKEEAALAAWRKKHPTPPSPAPK